MSTINLAGSTLTTALQELLMADDIQPGAAPSYQICKTIYAYHPLGAKLAENPIRLAQSQKREIAIPNSPEERVREAFNKEWEAIGADKHIFNVMSVSRIYGVSSIALLVAGLPTNVPVDFSKLHDAKISFNVFDPLNTAGSLVLNQDPNSMDFQKRTEISVAGTVYHRSRTVVILNEEPLYIEYTTSAFGYVGRSVYQRALFPLKSFVNTMVTDDMVTRKAGVLIAQLKQPGSILDNVMSTIAGFKRQILKEAQTNNVISIGETEKIETLNMQNLEAPYALARKNILENVASSAKMPARMVNDETFAEGFGEGTEDAKAVASYVDGVREEMVPLYNFFDEIVMYRAWNPEFYKTIQADFPEYKDKDHTVAFYEWKNSFASEWPSLLTEPDSEKIKVDDTKLKAVVELLEVLLPEMDPENKAILISWAADNFNELKLMFQSPLLLDMDALRAHAEELKEQAAEARKLGEEPGAGKDEEDRPKPRAVKQGFQL
jgi:hypothetical protein